MTASATTSAYPDRALEWLFASVMLAWGAWLLAPWWDTFNDPHYVALALLAPEPVWGAWSVAVGAVRGVALYVNGAHRRTPLVRCLCAALGVIWWLTLIWLFLLVRQPDPPAGCAVYLAFVVGELTACWRCAADAWHSGAFALHRVRGGERTA